MNGSQTGFLQLGYRLKVPLAVTGLALLSGVVVALTTLSLVDRHIESNAEAETMRLAATLARALAQPVLRNDVWQAYQAVRAATPAGDAGDDDAAGDRVGSGAAAETLLVVVLDAAGEIFVSSTPRRFAFGQHLSVLPEHLADAARQAMTRHPPVATRAVDPRGGHLALTVPLLDDDGALLGAVLVQHPRALTEAQRDAILRRLSLLGALGMGVVAFGGALLGVRLVAPLERLRSAMRAAPARQDISAIRGRTDEIGELARTFEAMLVQIGIKHELERHLLEAERMASAGQLTAGLAHEINNPVGGMLAAIENRRLRGSVDEHTARTLGLLERGLRQVHHTVLALLNETRCERHPLTPDDLGDLEVLLRPEAVRRGCTLLWEPSLPEDRLLPAVQVRQAVLNLALNGIAAAGTGGLVRVWCVATPAAWQVRVGNSGARLDEATFATLVGGAARARDGRLGLGVWVTARILQNVQGRLWLHPDPDPRFATILVAEFPAAANDVDDPEAATTETEKMDATPLKQRAGA